jgi:hypothetical protein
MEFLIRRMETEKKVQEEMGHDGDLRPEKRPKRKVQFRKYMEIMSFMDWWPINTKSGSM